jgi:hypothetical protein
MSMNENQSRTQRWRNQASQERAQRAFDAAFRPTATTATPIDRPASVVLGSVGGSRGDSDSHYEPLSALPADPDDDLDLSQLPDTPMHQTAAYSLQEVCTAILQTHGMLGATAKLLGLDPNTIRSYVRNYPEVEAAMKQARREFDDHAEEKLFELVNEKNPQVTMFYARTKLAPRGYREQLQVDILPYALQERLQQLCERTGISLEELTAQIISVLDRMEYSILNAQTPHLQAGLGAPPPPSYSYPPAPDAPVERTLPPHPMLPDPDDEQSSQGLEQSGYFE